MIWITSSCASPETAILSQIGTRHVHLGVVRGFLKKTCRLSNGSGLTYLGIFTLEDHPDENELENVLETVKALDFTYGEKSNKIA